MKGIDLFCASPASTAICVSSDHRSMIRHGGPMPIDRHSPHRHAHRHHLPRRPQPHVPCSSQLMPVIPRPYSEKTSRTGTSKQVESDARRKSSADIHDQKSPVRSARFLLSDRAFSDLTSSELLDRVDDLSAIVPVAQPTVDPRPSVSTLSIAESPTLRSSQSTRARDQVVVLRVSLHCKGCESKLKRHLAKMEGVTSYSIDLETKRVTIRGDITPLGILSNVSRVKYAQLWPTSSSPSALQSPSWSA